MSWGKHIQRALDRAGTHDLSDVEGMIARGEAQLWLGERSAAVTEIVVYPKHSVLNLWLCGGDLREIVEDMLPKAEEFAKAKGCKKMRTGGRKGWDRVMSGHGFSTVASICEKELS